MPNRSGINLDLDDIQRRLRDLNPDIDRAIAAVVKRQAPKAEAWMKINAPWTDRTGNARATLRAEPINDDGVHDLELTGAMPYQVYLETKNSGRYAIIQPAMLHWGRILMSQMEGLMDRLGRR
jgi:hypothetical protein